VPLGSFHIVGSIETSEVSDFSSSRPSSGSFPFSSEASGASEAREGEAGYCVGREEELKEEEEVEEEICVGCLLMIEDDEEEEGVEVVFVGVVGAALCLAKRTKSRRCSKRLTSASRSCVSISLYLRRYVTSSSSSSSK
jgi:hypothetical protein